MMRRILLLIVAITFSLSFDIANSYDNELVVFEESQKSIRELKENINELDSDSKKLDDRLNDLNADYRLKFFLRTDLSSYDIKQIKVIVDSYNDAKKNIESKQYVNARNLDPTINEKKLLLEEKKKFYSGLIKYIDIRFKKQYLEYIKHDVIISTQKSDVTTDIIRKKEILNNKVESIENKIKDHKKKLNDNLNKLIEKKIKEKIESLKNNEKFRLLNKQTKVKVLDKTITVLKEKMQNYKESSLQNHNSSQDKKLQTYKIAIKMLEKFKKSLLEKKTTPNN